MPGTIPANGNTLDLSPMWSIGFHRYWQYRDISAFQDESSGVIYDLSELHNKEETASCLKANNCVKACKNTIY